MATNEITTNKMENNNVEGPVQVMMKNPKKVEQGKRLAEWNCRNKEKLAQTAKAQESKPKLSQAYSIGAVIDVVVLGLLGYYIYQRGSPKGETISLR